MTDILATLIRFQQFVFEYGPFFLTAWFAVASATGLIAVARDRWINFETSKWQLLLSMLWRPEGKMPGSSIVSGVLLFSLAASVPSLVITSLVGMKVVWMRLILAGHFALFVSRSVKFLALRKLASTQDQTQEAGPGVSSLVLNNDNPVIQPKGLHLLVRVTWKSFTGRANSAVLPLLTSFALGSAFIVYVPTYAISPWLGEGVWPGPYLAAFLVTPFQLVGGAEVVLASALLIKGTSLGTAMSVMLAAPVTTFSMFRHLNSTMKARTIILYLLTVWFTAGTLGLAIDGTERLLNMWR